MNKISDMFFIHDFKFLTLPINSSLNEIYAEASANNILITVAEGFSLDSESVLIAKPSQPGWVKTKDVAIQLVRSLLHADDETIYIQVPDHLNPTSLITATYKTSESMGIKVSVGMTDGTHVFVKARQNLTEITDKMLNMNEGDTNDFVKPPSMTIDKLRKWLHKQFGDRGLYISTKSTALGLSVTVLDNNEALPPTRFPHDLSLKRRFFDWLDSIPWDVPTPMTTLDNIKYFTHLASCHPLRCINTKNGVFTKRSVCLSKEDGLVVLRHKGEVIYTTKSRSVNRIDDLDISEINLKLIKFGKTFEEIR